MEKLYTKEDLDRAREGGYDVGVKNVKGENHISPSPETRERLKALEVNQNNFMTEIQEIKQMIKDLGMKLDCALEKKADKEIVDGMKNDLELLKNWKWKMVGVGIVVVFFIYVLKDYILGKGW